MKTNLSPTRFLIATLVLAALSGATAAKAGPGIQYWTASKDARVEMRTPATAQPPSSGPACTDAKLVQVTETKKEWANARGPLTTVVTGAKVICTSCVSTAVVAKRSWTNGKGPLVSTPVAAQHECLNCGSSPAKI